MGINDWPAEDRPREKLLQRGAGALTDAELLAIFLRVGVQGKSAVDLARELLERFGGLRGLFAAERQEFCTAKGLGPAKFAQLRAVVEMSRRYLEAELRQGAVLDNPEATHRYLKACLWSYPNEVFAALYLDNRLRVLHFEELFRGTINRTSVHPREVARRALQTNAAAVIFAHNHPSGWQEPSADDIDLTERLRQALALFDVRVVDHLVIGEGRATSLRERGLI